MAKKKWHNLELPWETFEMFTPSGQAVVFRIREGDWEGYGFVRPTKTVRRAKSGQGFQLGYTMEQSFDANGDVISETAEEIEIKKTARGEDGSFVTVDEQTIAFDFVSKML